MAVDDAAALLQTAWETDATTVGGLRHRGARPPAGGRRDGRSIGDFEFEVERVADRAIEVGARAAL